MKPLVIVVMLLMVIALGLPAQGLAPDIKAPAQTKTQVPDLHATTQLTQIDILSPSGGEWNPGNVMPITFTISTATVKWVKLLVKKEADTFYSFPHIAVARNPAKTTFNWTIPKDAILGEKYTIEVVSEDSAAIHKASSPFVIKSPNPSVSALGKGGIRTDVKQNLSVEALRNINVTSPTVGDRWVITNDASITVQWDHPSYLKVTTVNIKLLKGDGTLLKPLAAGIPFSAGSFKWKPIWSGIAPGEHRIQITDAASIDVQGTSDPFFFDAQTIAFTSPVANAKLIAGMKYTISWNYNGSNKQTIKIMVGDRILAENAPISAGSAGTGKGNLELTIPVIEGNSTIRLRTTGSGIDSASVPVNLVLPSLAITAPASAEAWNYSSSACTVAWNYNGNPNDIMSIYMAFNGYIDTQGHTMKDQILGKPTAGTGSYQFSKEELIRKIPFKIRIETPYSSDQTAFNIRIN
jgi:hypothetical protein